MIPKNNNEYDYDKIVDAQVSAFRVAIQEDLEEQKHEVWSCKIGDMLEVIAKIEFADNEDGEATDTPFWVEIQPQGQVYRVADLKGRGFDLQLVSGEGPREIRAMNSEIPGKFRVLPHP